MTTSADQTPKDTIEADSAAGVSCAAPAGYVTCPECCGWGKLPDWPRRARGAIKARSPCYKCLGTGRILRSTEECSHTAEVRHGAKGSDLD